MLNVTAARQPAARPGPRRQGLIFISTGNVRVTRPIKYVDGWVDGSDLSRSAQTTSGASSWLSVRSGDGDNVGFGAGAQSNISANTAGLATACMAERELFARRGQVPTVNVTLMVAERGPELLRFRDHSGTKGNATSPGCTPTQIIPTQTAPGEQLLRSASWPTPLEITVSDDCGNPVTNGQVAATFSNGDPPWR